MTSHSPELLDDPDIRDDSILAVESKDGVTVIGPVDEAGRSVLHDRLFTPGELLRQNQLAPSPESFVGKELARRENGCGLQPSKPSTRIDRSVFVR